MNISTKFKQIILLAGDILVLYFSLYSALWLRYRQVPSEDTLFNHVWVFSFLFIVWLTVFYISGLYNLHQSVNTGKFYETAVKSVIASFLLSIAFFYITPSKDITPKTNLIIFAIVFIILFLVWRHFFNRLLKNYLPKNNIAFIGFNRQAEEIIQEIKSKPQLGYVVKLIVEKDFIWEHEFSEILVRQDIDGLKEAIIDLKVNTIVLSADPHQSDELRSFLFELLPLNIKYAGLPGFYESITGKVPIEAINQMWFLENLNNADKNWFELVKRFYDVILAVLVLALTMPFWPFIILIIKLESKGPIFIKMVRSGKNGAPFRMFKFRTMREEGNTRAITVKNDPRITRFGNFMRKTRIDEFPQAINILSGDMSFIGPRPERPELVIELEKQIPFYRERMLIKPGITGWDQVSGEYHSPSIEDSLKKLQYDLFYIKNRSVYLDLSIFLKTIAAVLRREGR